MRAPFIFLACLLALSGVSQARLGETLDECMERYGPVIDKRPAEFSQSDPELAVFSKSAVTIMVEFKDGKAWHITFRKPVMTPAEVESLFKANAGEEDWSPPLTIGGRVFRQADDHARLGVYNESREGMLATMEFMNRDYIDQYRASFLARVGSPESIETIKRKSNPLPGF
jgi:hypothetical protein